MNNSQDESLSDFIPFNQSPQQRYGNQGFSPKQFSSPNNQRNNWRGRNNRFSHSPSQSPNSSNDRYQQNSGGGPYRRNNHKFGNRNSGGRGGPQNNQDDISRYCNHDMVVDPWQKLMDKFQEDELKAAKFDEKFVLDDEKSEDFEDSNPTGDTDLDISTQSVEQTEETVVAENTSADNTSANNIS